RFRFKHPSTGDFIAVVNEIVGENPDWHKDQPVYSKISSKIVTDNEPLKPNFNWYFDQALRSNAVLDYSVELVRSLETTDPKGYDYTYFADSIDANGSGSGEDERDDSMKVYATDVRIRRLGDFIFPVEVECLFNNGEKIRERWDGQDLWKRYRFEKPAKIVYATVDPERKIPLDINYMNNSKTLDFQALGVNKTALQFMFWVQTLLDQPEHLNALTFLPAIF
ncbi:MAG: hypothetical protein L0Y73_05425, partial [Candidatus Aminicenantes bacterium]|nr:hypothetical protein [Candidatus Aminicenantes bacterium]